MTRNQNFVLTINGEDMSQEMRAYAEYVGLEAAAPGRYSALLVISLFERFVRRLLNPMKVIAEIRSLEGIDAHSKTKGPLPFKHPPLKGLWHKHYLPDGLRYMARNLLNGIKKDGLPWFEQRAREAAATGEEHYLTPDDVNSIAHDASIGNFLRRSAAAELTGEWIVYAKHGGGNYYLALGEHDGDHAKLRADIDAACRPEFPFLASLLGPAQH